MFDVSENTPTRLVMTLGARSSLWSKYILDKTAGRARFERRLLIFPRRPIDVPLSEIVAADPIVFGSAESVTYYVVVKLKSGKAYWLAGDSLAASIAAAGHIRRFLGLPEPASSADTVPRSARWMAKAATALAVIAVAVIVLGQAGRFLWLPGCDAHDSVQKASELWTQVLSNTVSLSDAKTVATGKTETRCQAVVTLGAATATVGYRLFWDGWTAKIQTTGIVGTDKLDPARMSAIDAAAANFMARAQDSHKTGNPPRQADPAVKPLLDTIFGTSDLDGKTLAGSEIDAAIRWFNAGETAGSVYVLAGTGFDDTEKLPADETARKRTRDNVVQFADEFGRYVDFQIRILGAIADATWSAMNNSAPEDWEKSDIKGKVDDIRTSLAQAMGSDLISITYEGLNDGWRMNRLAVLAAVARTASGFLTPEQARGVREQALEVVAYLHNAQVQDEVRRLADLVAKP
jgi:hypothetical protein